MDNLKKQIVQELFGGIKPEPEMLEKCKITPIQFSEQCRLKFKQIISSSSIRIFCFRHFSLSAISNRWFTSEYSLVKVFV
jgi:hypothetical protein